MEGLLNTLNLFQGLIYEIIISAYKSERSTTAAPMGITFQNEIFRFKTFTRGSFLKGLEYSKCGVVNFTFDPKIFYKTTFKEKNPGGELPKNFFEKAHSVKAPRIRSSNAYIEFTIDNISYDVRDQAIIICQPESIEVRKNSFQPYCRGFSAAIECIIHATRIRKYLLERRMGDAEELINLIGHYSRLVHRVAPHSSSLEVIDEIIHDIREWRRIH